MPLAQLVACWPVSSDLHWWTLGSCGTGGAWASISRYTPRRRLSRKPRLGRSFALRCSSCRTSSSTWEESSCRSFAVRRGLDSGPDRSLILSCDFITAARHAREDSTSTEVEIKSRGGDREIFIQSYYSSFAHIYGASMERR